MWKLSIDMAERNGSALRRRLASADLFREAAMARGELCVNTPGSRSSALLLFITWADQRCGLGRARAGVFRAWSLLRVWRGARRLPALAVLPRLLVLEATIGHAVMHCRSGRSVN